ncbi:hypothetical protein [Vibrio metschnikovii]|uniref:hypothetical protein n=1 Tax=Vibrio metschnikovii TaxID=28172 RepID=UPI0013027227|nr:hypothetical protein [Vibrio metschnikovii]
MKRHQQGIATLLITAILLSITLVITLGSYKNLFYQIKRAQNEVSARQSYWLAEGGVECLYAYIAQDPTRITGLSKQVSGEANNCKQQLQLDELQLIPLENSVYRIYARQGYAQVNKQIYSYTTGTGAIQTNANLRLVGSFEIQPEAVGEADNDGFYDCIAVRYKYQVEFHPSSGSGLQTQDADAGTKPCKPNSKTSIAGSREGEFSTKDSPEFKTDFVQDKYIKPFESYFGLAYTPANYQKIKSEHYLIELNAEKSINCSHVIQQAFKSHKKVWLQGDCFINAGFSAPNGRSLVVENGLFATNGASVYGGAFFHTINPSIHRFSDPTQLALAWQKAPFYEVIKDLLTSNTVYVDRGAFRPDGGIVFDADGAEIVIGGAFALHYRSSNNPYERLEILSLQQGSWHGY